MAKILKTIVFGGGCFWCSEAVFQRVRGVERVTSGYAGGEMPRPTYEDVFKGSTGHAEVIKLEYDPAIISYKELLAVFFSIHDPTTPDRQGSDVGPQYRSVIFYTTPQERDEALEYIEKLEQDGVFTEPIVTEVKALREFYPAEEYHQNYYNRNSSKPYCELVINPKLAKLKQQYADKLKK